MSIPEYVKATPAKHVSTEVQLQLAEARSRCRPATHHRFSFFSSILLSNTICRHETSNVQLLQHRLLSIRGARVEQLRLSATGSVSYKHDLASTWQEHATMLPKWQGQLPPSTHTRRIVTSCVPCNSSAAYVSSLSSFRTHLKPSVISKEHNDG